MPSTPTEPHFPPSGNNQDSGSAVDPSLIFWSGSIQFYSLLLQGSYASKMMVAYFCDEVEKFTQKCAKQLQLLHPREKDRSLSNTMKKEEQNQVSRYICYPYYHIHSHKFFISSSFAI